MPNYIVTIDMGDSCYTFLCTEYYKNVAMRLINEHVDTYFFYGDPQITKIGNAEFELFEKSGLDVITNTENYVESKMDVIKNRAKYAKVTGDEIYEIWQKRGYCDITELSRELRLSERIIQQKLKKSITK